MNNSKNAPNPDNREDNVEKLQEMVQNTIQNIEAAHETMRFASEEEKQKIEEKNAHREESIESLRQEIKDEHDYQQNHK